MRNLLLSTTLFVLLLSFHTASAAPIKILIVPGHDDASSGAVYNGMKESTLTLELGQKLFNEFTGDPLFEPYLARTALGYTPEIASYFVGNKDQINEYRQHVKEEKEKLLASGFAQVDGVTHNNASEEVGFKLYGINKWANDHGIDLVLHVHFNDVPRADTSAPGDYSGFTIYAPDTQYANGWKSQEISTYVYDHLSKYFATSNLNKENAGIVSEQELIAIGSNNSLTAKSLLIEYGYIYEAQHLDPKVRLAVFQKMADETYAGVKEYFTSKKGSIKLKNSLVTNKFTTLLEPGMQGSTDVLALQAALLDLGFYPAGVATKNDCPLSGKFGPCTKAAVMAFQRHYGISPLGFVGPATRAKLNALLAK